MKLFASSWASLRSAVAGLADYDLLQPSGCRGWLVRDLVCHLVIDAQDVLITLATPSEAAPTRNATTYWDLADSLPSGGDPLDALTVRLAAAYQEPWLLKFHLDDLGSAAERAARLADPRARVQTKDEVLSVADYLTAYVVEWTLHHLDLVAHLPHVPGPADEALAATREVLGEIAGAPLPESFSDVDVLRVVTGRRAPTGAEQAALDRLHLAVPLVLA
ncbi:maleylpyruvate isomerase [Saccharopolyspora rhizosphaerae]|uniref:Maleylpyruvate isomerase n=1 Tax=Saccharopolyspora rhizosphaerae TaxID=2492662 RepID=A0A3R8NZN9_9PSEU|nr:maleylpyruvate isomerase N-terminal domain-containing protein [Saccharopolyspora rhizosphaerae]RRO16756.1 maleylpyruvate isomerase [Saccharopolyspora rhizosphaerae]